MYFSRHDIILNLIDPTEVGGGLTDHGRLTHSSKGILLKSFRTAFVVNVGVPYTKTLRLFPSMSLPEFYFIHPAGCARAMNKTFNGLPCDRSRGGIFNHNSSNSHVHNSIYDFSSNAVFQDFGYSMVKGDVGWDTVSLGFLKENAGYGRMENLEHVLVAEVSSNNFTWLGMLGIDVRRTNFSDTGEKAPQETLMSKPKRSNYIPSLSWAYTAGCYGCKYFVFLYEDIFKV
jgi:hypothetical protein